MCKTIFRVSFIALNFALLMTFAACDPINLSTDEALSTEDSHPSVKAFVPPFVSAENDETRIEVSVVPTGAQFRWENNDAIGIYAVSDIEQQIKYTLEGGQGTSEAHFGSDSDFALDPGAGYVSYYPYDSYGYSSNQIAVNYYGQSQVGNASTAHLGKYDYMASPVAYANDPSEMELNFSHLGCLVQLNLTVNGDDSFNALAITGLNKGWALESTVDLTAEVPSIALDAVRASFFEMKLSDIASTETSRNLTIYLMLPPADYSGETWDLELKGAEKSYWGKISPVNQLPGRAYRYFADLRKPYEMQFVDLGLSVLWATTNLGAIEPEDRGSYYSWGETETKTLYLWDTYFESTPSKYSNGSGGLQVLKAEDDAATHLWSTCRMPTEDEMKELINNCDWNPTFDDNRVVGYAVVSKKNGNSIYMPVAGEAKSTGVEDPSQMKYWTSTLSSTGTRARRLEVVYDKEKNTVTAKIGTADRYIGRTVRPVKER